MIHITQHSKCRTMLVVFSSNNDNKLHFIFMLTSTELTEEYIFWSMMHTFITMLRKVRTLNGTEEIGGHMIF